MVEALIQNEIWNKMRIYGVLRGFLGLALLPYTRC